jgi:hypothetical protein
MVYKSPSGGYTLITKTDVVYFMYSYFSSIFFETRMKIKKLKTSYPESASELYRQSDRRLLAKLVPTSADRGCHVVKRYGSLRLYSLFSRPDENYRTKTVWVLMDRISDNEPPEETKGIIT